MNISEQGLALIKQFEGFSSAPYYCPAGLLTIGYGHVVRAPAVAAEITEEHANQLLEEDLAPVEAAVNRLVDAPMSQAQFDALCSLVYNIGIGAFAGSTLLRRLNEGEVSGAAEQFGRWVYAGKTILPGLVRRRAAEKELFMKNNVLK